MSKSSAAPTIACFGEILWDCLPRGLFLGGAPLNVAYHLSRQRVRALPISAVGRDFLGDEALRRIATWALDTRHIARRPDLPTGTVRAQLDRSGVARYLFPSDVAWDRITPSRLLLRQRPPAAIVYGTLALRDTPNQRTLARLSAAWPRALRVLDLNLRAPFDRGTPVALALQHAQMVKLNDEELGRMTGLATRTPRQLEQTARHFAHAHRLSCVLVSAGARGAGMFRDDCWFWEDARPVVVRDTIGAGDAFLAAMLAALLARNASPRQALASACRLGEYVAARDGATPAYTCDAHGRPGEPAA